MYILEHGQPLQKESAVEKKIQSYNSGEFFQ